MAEVKPFRGILYNSEKIEDLAAVVTPPFDVISPGEQDDAYASHPNNMIRLELNKPNDRDTAENNPHTRSAACWNQWISEGTLIRDRQPAFYLTSTEFYLAGRRVIRHGIIGWVRLEPFKKGIVLPHEKTFSRVRSERLNLMKASHANFSPIFSLYPDPGNQVIDSVTRGLGEQAPDIDFVDTNEQRQRLWRIRDAKIQKRVTAQLTEKQIYIADGHHRYETALAYRAWQCSRNPDLPSDDPARYVMMYLTAMEDPGLIILPAHRLLKSVPAETRETLLQKAPEFFELEILPGITNGDPGAKARFAATLEAGSGRHTIGTFMKGHDEFFLMTLKPEMMNRLYEDELSKTLREIDVTVLTRLILMDLLGFDQARLDNDRLIGYASTLDQAVEEVARGEFDITFILNPTKIGQVRKIADKRLIMPRKATYFYPKVITGMVLNALSE